VGVEVDMDTLVARCLVHDISKRAESARVAEYQDVDELLGHPHFAVYMLADAGFSVHVQHIALSHSPFSSADPKTIEAKIVQLADLQGLHATYWKETGHLLGQE
jgi:hypothetical protein